MMLERLRQALLGQRPIRDEDFDTIYPVPYPEVSSLFWTRVETARRAADLLVGDGARRVLAVGAGVGKFCIVGAFRATQATFTGVEPRAHLADVARHAIRQLGAERVEIIHGRFDAIAAASFDSFYLYNPFADSLFGSAWPLDDRVSLSQERFHADVLGTLALLSAAPPGTRVVAYYGYGGRLPPGYDLVHAESSEIGALQLWIKDEPAQANPSTRSGSAVAS